MFRVIAVDDEKKALDRFERIAESEPRLSVAGKFSEAEDAVDFVCSNPVDIAFLDIEMPGTSGLELAELLYEVSGDIEIVFITAYDQYALKAFQAHAIGYLLKPLDNREFKEQVDLLERKLMHRNTAAKPAKLSVSCLGQFFCAAGERGEPIRWRTAKAEELFALLVHYQGKPISREILIDQLWPDAEPDKAANYFRVTCTYLRNTLADKGFPGILSRERNSYLIDTDVLDCDSYRYLAALMSLSAAETGPLSLEEASRLYSGAYFENKPYEWAHATRIWMENAYGKLLHRLADTYTENGDDVRACQTLERILLHDPMEEEAVEKLISNKLLNGDNVAALKIYREYEQKILKELGAIPPERLKKRLDSTGIL